MRWFVGITVYLMIGVGFAAPIQSSHPDANIVASIFAWPVALGVVLAREVMK